MDEIDVLFFCTAHGDTRKFMESHNVPEDLKIIDLSMDYRIKSDDHDLFTAPELNRRATCTAKHVANPDASPPVSSWDCFHLPSI